MAWRLKIPRETNVPKRIVWRMKCSHFSVSNIARCLASCRGSSETFYFFHYTGCLVWPRRWTHLAMRKKGMKKSRTYFSFAPCCQALGLKQWRDNVKRGENGRNWHVFTPLKWCIWKFSPRTYLACQASSLVMTQKDDYNGRWNFLGIHLECPSSFTSGCKLLRLFRGRWRVLHYVKSSSSKYGHWASVYYTR